MGIMATTASPVRLPTGWSLTKLGQVLVQNNSTDKLSHGTLYRLLGVRLAGNAPFLREEKMGHQIRASHLSKVHAGDFIYSRLFAWRGAFGVIPEELDGAYVSNEFPTFSVDPSRLDVDFLRLYFSQRALWSEVEACCTGTTKASRNRFKEEFFLAMEIPLPPLDEQQRIVSRIEELAIRVEQARRLRLKASEESRTLVTAALRRFFAAHDRWREVKLEDVCETIIDNLHSNPVYADSGIPCVRSPDVGWGELYLDRALYTSKDEYTRRTIRGEPRPDDVVFVREGGGTGKAALVKPGERFSLGQRVMMIRPNKALVLPKFFLYQLLSPQIFEEQILELTKGSASPHLNIGAFKKFTFLLPHLEKQTEIVSYVDCLKAKVKCLQRLQSETTVQLDAFMPSILSKAFRGEL